MVHFFLKSLGVLTLAGFAFASAVSLPAVGHINKVENFQITRREWHVDGIEPEPGVEYFFHPSHNATGSIVVYDENGVATTYGYNFKSYSCGLIHNQNSDHYNEVVTEFCDLVQDIASEYYGSATDWANTLCTGGNPPLQGACKQLVFIGMQALDHYTIGPAVKNQCKAIYNGLSSYCHGNGGVLTADFTTNGEVSSEGSANVAFEKPSVTACPNPSKPAPGEPSTCKEGHDELKKRHPMTAPPTRATLIF